MHKKRMSLNMIVKPVFPMSAFVVSSFRTNILPTPHTYEASRVFSKCRNTAIPKRLLAHCPNKSFSSRDSTHDTAIVNGSAAVAIHYAVKARVDAQLAWESDAHCHCTALGQTDRPILMHHLVHCLHLGPHYSHNV